MLVKPFMPQKDNWSGFQAEIARAFYDPAMTVLLAQATSDGDHGRIKPRPHAVNHDVAFLDTDRRLPGLKATALVEAEVERAGKTIRARRFYLGSLPLDAVPLAHAAREPWRLENRLPLMLDVVFHGDLSPVMYGQGPQNMTTDRHVAPDPLRGAKNKHILKVRRRSAA